MTEERKKKIGSAVSKYDPALCEKIVAYFAYMLSDENRSKNTGQYKKLPSYVDFARKTGVTSRTIENWRIKHKRFGEACDECDAMLQEAIISDALLYRMHANFGKFVLSSRYGMKEQVEIRQAGADSVQFTAEESELLLLHRDRKEKEK